MEKVTLESGSVYEGDLLEGNPHGKGKIIYTDGTVYEGDWIDGLPHGKGIVVMTNGDVYKGDLIKGAMTGKGKRKYADDGVCSYIGDFVDGKPHGKGTMRFTDGNICEGDFANGVPCGETRWTFPNGLDIEEDEDEVEVEDTLSKQNVQQTTAKSDDEIKLIDPADTDDYDVVVNAQNEIMIVMYAREGNPLSPQAFRTTDGDILLKRNQNDIVIFDSLTSESFEHFTKVSTILINEIDNDGLSVNVYDAPLSDQ
ncbi:MAG: hypothetical protein FWB73_07625 [Treponema sp.]|nr:hypothetical protein [Treponema sp.]